MARVLLTLCFVIVIYSTVGALKVPFLQDSWFCIECPRYICRRVNCVAEARQYLYHGNATWDSDLEWVVFTCDPGYTIVGPKYAMCNVCKDFMVGPPPSCQRIHVPHKVPGWISRAITPRRNFHRVAKPQNPLLDQ